MNQVSVTLLAVGAMLGAGVIWFTGYDTGYRKASEFYIREQDLQEAVNREAVNLAGRRYTKRIDEIEDEKQALEDLLKRVQLEADADPNAAMCGISAASSMRLNSVR